MSDRIIARPFVKWAGGKTSLLAEILKRLPSKINTYYEPFVGGGAVFFALAAEKRFKRAVLNDVNKELMTVYSVVRDNLEPLFRCLNGHAREHEETYFYSVRAMNPRTPVAIAGRLIYLNKTCFNGLYRVNKKGGFNVPFGAYKNPTICDVENLTAARSALANAMALSHDFSEAMGAAGRGDTVYFDPPYVPASDTANFTSYSKSGFGAVAQERLVDTARELGKRGVHVLLSNSDTPYVRRIYKGFKIEKVRARRNINSKGAKRGKVGEVLISWKG